MKDFRKDNLINIKHSMKLLKSPFELIKSGKKVIEVRLFDEKRQSLNLGDIITFSKLPDLNESLTVEIVGLLRYRTFQDLVEEFPMSYFGYPDDYDKQAYIESIYTIYAKEKEEKYGVLGIRIKLV